MIRRLSAARAAALLDGATTADGPAYAALADGLRRLIADGRIPVGTALPSERELTGVLGVSRTTVTRAYAVLKETGYVEARHGSGSTARLPDAARAGDAMLGHTSPGITPDEGVSEGVINLSCAAPVTPPGVVAAFEQAVAELPSYVHGIGYFPTGLPTLREAIAARYEERGVPTDPDQVIVTSGALGSLAMVLAAFARSGERGLTESPSYPNAIAAMKQAGLRLVGAEVTGPGWAGGGSLVETVRQVRPDIAYLMPDWHNPTGQLMPDEQRAEVARALRASRSVTVVDETMAELALDPHEPVRPFAAHHPSTISIGSASKTYWGGLRIGWLRAPRDRVATLLQARTVLDLGSPVVEQLALVHLMRRHDELQDVRRRQLAESRAALVSSLTGELPSWSFRVPGGGLSLWCELPRPASSALTTAAERHGVRLAPGPLFAPEGGLERFVRVPYSQPPDTVREAVDRIARGWHEMADEPVRRRRHQRPALVT